MRENFAAYEHPDFDKWITMAEEVAEALKAEDNLCCTVEPLEVVIDNAVCFWYKNMRRKENLRSFLCRSLAATYPSPDDHYEEICIGKEEWC